MLKFLALEKIKSYKQLMSEIGLRFFPTKSTQGYILFMKIYIFYLMNKRHFMWKVCKY